MVRKKGLSGNYYQIIGNDDNLLLHIQCKHCSKDFQRADSEKMQAHLNESVPRSTKIQLQFK